MSVAAGFVLDFRTIGDPIFDELGDDPTELVIAAYKPPHAPSARARSVGEFLVQNTVSWN
jgi:hypothetical protein